MSKEQIFEVIFSEMNALTGYAFSFVRNWKKAERIIHDTLQGIEKQWQDHESEETIHPWIRGLIRHACVDYLEKDDASYRKSWFYNVHLMIQRYLDEYWMMDSVEDKVSRQLVEIKNAAKGFSESEIDDVHRFFIREKEYGCSDVVQRKLERVKSMSERNQMSIALNQTEEGRALFPQCDQFDRVFESYCLNILNEKEAELLKTFFEQEDSARENLLAYLVEWTSMSIAFRGESAKSQEELMQKLRQSAAPAEEKSTGKESRIENLPKSKSIPAHGKLKTMPGYDLHKPHVPHITRVSEKQNSPDLGDENHPERNLRNFAANHTTESEEPGYYSNVTDDTDEDSENQIEERAVSPTKIQSIPRTSTPRNEVSTGKRIALYIASVFAFSIIGLNAWYLWIYEEKLEPNEVAIIDTINGNIVFERDGKRIAVEPGIRIKYGDFLQVAKGGSASIRYPGESTTLVLNENTKVDFPNPKAKTDEERKRIHLYAGKIDAKVSAQPAGKEMVVTTPNAVLTVLSPEKQQKEKETGDLASSGRSGKFQSKRG